MLYSMQLHELQLSYRVTQFRSPHVPYDTVTVVLCLEIGLLLANLQTCKHLGPEPLNLGRISSTVSALGNCLLGHKLIIIPMCATDPHLYLHTHIHIFAQDCKYQQDNNQSPPLSS